MKKILKRILVVLVILVMGVGIYAGVLIALDREPIISEVHASYIIDMYDLDVITGFVDHVFVGRVVRNAGTVSIDGSPFTNYEVEVLEVIKGDLMPGVVVPVEKWGGPILHWLVFLLNRGRIPYLVRENDSLPQTDNIYVFRASTGEDGSMLLAGPNSNNLLIENAEVAGGIVPQAAYSDYYAAAIEAYENEVLFERERFPTPAEFRAPQE